MSKSPKTLKPFLTGFTILTFIFCTPLLAQHYTQTNLVSNIPGRAAVTDPNLQNAWGLIAGTTTPWWISNNAGGTSTLYAIDAHGAAHIVPINAPSDFVLVPNAPSQPAPGSPTSVMFNGSANDFLLAPGQRSIFLFVTEDGTVQGWNPNVSSPSAVIKVDNSQKPDPANGAVYKGATVVEANGKRFILAANFRSGHVDVFDTNFQQVRLHDDDSFDEDAFRDDEIPHGFAPFNVQAVGPNVYVTYARQDAARHDPVGGAGFGFVDVFSPTGKLRSRLQHGNWFNAPWGVVLAPENFGEFSHALLIGNFRGGTVAAFNPVTGRFLGNVLNPDGSALVIDGLWALRFGNSDGSTNPANGALKSNSGSALTLFFTAGPDGEKNGLFGTLTPIATELNDADEQ